ncbi:LEPR-XLL domain-containing protein [Mesorhizobium sp. M7A.F.Ca.CA.002.15.1.1]|nr:LEPR-XLL domain-containing protein [Mesorhizobium sp. M7A.F.Ca.CA.001.13.2.1]RUZ10975.1 LEPR-XLL domain-containing protein [Mesorhizobium sp. M7A.F.Ca.CA.002.15.1.1]
MEPRYLLSSDTPLAPLT